MRLTSFKYLLVLLMLLHIPSISSSQISRYWSESFSTKSALLSGAVVGGYQDESSIYYNPSILSDSSVNQFAFANGLGKVDVIRYENAIGTDLDVGNWESTVDPGFISVNLYPKRKFGLVWKAAIFNKTKYDNGFTQEFRDTYNVIPIVPGDENYLGRVSTRTEFNDYWYGVGVAKFINEKFSIGLSAFARYSSIRYEYGKLVEVTRTDINSISENISVNNQSISLNGYNWRSTIKIGANYRINPNLRLGFVVTAPSISVMGNSDVIRNDSRVNVPSATTGGLLPDYLYDQYGENLSFKVKDPLSIAAGIDFQKEKYRWNVTIEWFAGLAPYKMVDQSVGKVYTTISPNGESDPDYLSFSGGGKSIANIAIGVEKYLPNNRSWLFGFKTDFDALKNYDYEEYSELNTLVNAKTNYYHFSTGKNFQFLNFEVLFGIQYSLSRAKGLTSFANFTPPISYDPNKPYILEGPETNNMNFKGDAITVFVGLTLRN